MKKATLLLAAVVAVAVATAADARGRKQVDDFDPAEMNRLAFVGFLSMFAPIVVGWPVTSYVDGYASRWSGAKKAKKR